jgi:hypothetical protein
MARRKAAARYQNNGLPQTGNMQLQLPEARIGSTHVLYVLSATTRSYDSLLSTYTDRAAQ